MLYLLQVSEKTIECQLGIESSTKRSGFSDRQQVCIFSAVDGVRLLNPLAPARNIDHAENTLLHLFIIGCYWVFTNIGLFFSVM